MQSKTMNNNIAECAKKYLSQDEIFHFSVALKCKFCNINVKNITTMCSCYEPTICFTCFIEKQIEDEIICPCCKDIIKADKIKKIRIIYYVEI